MVLFELILFILSLLVLGSVSDESYLACTSSFRNISGLDFKKKQGCVYLLNDENDARQYITTICACQDISMLDHGTLLSLGLMTQDGHSAIAHVATGRGVKLTLFQGRSFDGHVAFVNEKLELSLSNKLDSAGQSMNKRVHSIKIKSQEGSCPCSAKKRGDEMETSVSDKRGEKDFEKSIEVDVDDDNEEEGEKVVKEESANLKANQRKVARARSRGVTRTDKLKMRPKNGLKSSSNSKPSLGEDDEI